MGEAFIVRRGGGAGKAYAVIAATYPAGSTITCTDGSKSLKPQGSDGQALFLIPYAATWTVTITDGTDTVSQDVVISTEGQAVSVELSYTQTLWLYKEGDECVDVTGGWVMVDGLSTGYVQNEATALAIHGPSGGATTAGPNTLGNSWISNYSVIYVRCNAISASTAFVTINTTKDRQGTNLGQQSLVANDTVMLDVSAIDSGYLCLVGLSGNIYVADVWAE